MVVNEGVFVHPERLIKDKSSSPAKEKKEEVKTETKKKIYSREKEDIFIDPNIQDDQIPAGMKIDEYRRKKMRLQTSNIKSIKETQYSSQ